MKRVPSFYLSLIFTFFFITCTKENRNTGLQSNNISELTTVVDTAKIPLNDLGTGTFKTYTGGLYPGGMNSPTGVYASDLMTASNAIIPLDTFGKAKATGRILFISLGGSTGGHNMEALKDKTVGNPLTNPKLRVLNCNNGYGSGSLNSIINPNDAYWDHVTEVIKGNKSSYRQVQVIYLETDDSTSTSKWPTRPTKVKNELETALRVFKKKFKNIKIVYVLGRTRTFGNLQIVNKEPNPYYFGWACKWSIEDQINGVPGTKYKGTGAVAPMITWGFYQWADSLPRITDGFFWRSSSTSDGMHATDEGQDTLSSRFQRFLLTDPYASVWYAAH